MRKQDFTLWREPTSKATFYKAPFAATSSVAYAEQLHGKELSYNNINDADAALSIVKEFTEPAVVAVKHMNPCGVGVGTDIHEAYTRAYEADPVSILEALLQRIVKLIKLQLKSYMKFS